MTGRSERPTGSAMVTLAHAPDGIRAHLLVSILASRGVEAAVVGENATILGPFGGNASSSVHVRLADYTRAVEELKAFLIERDAESGGCVAFARPAGRCPACGYDATGLGGRTRCPECGVDQDALARVKQWIRLAPPPRELAGSTPGLSSGERAFEVSGVVLGAVTLGLAAFGLLTLIILISR